MHHISLPASEKNLTLLQVHAAVNLFYKLLTFRFFFWWAVTKQCLLDWCRILRWICRHWSL